MPIRPHELHTVVHRILARRLLLAAALVALVFGAIAYVRATAHTAEQVQWAASAGIERLRADVRARLAAGIPDLAQAVQQALDDGDAAQPGHGHGQFVHVRLLDPDGALLGERLLPPALGTTPTLQSIDAARRQGGEDVPPRRIDVAGRPHLWLTLPVRGRDGAVVARAEGLFRLSDAAIADARRAALAAALSVVLIVAGTALLLYPVILTLMRRLARHAEQLLAANLDTLETLGSAIAKRDSDTDAHNFRVTLYALRMAEVVGLDGDQQRALVKGAFLHDVGKIGIPDRVLLKPGRLDADEFNTMQGHVEHGIDIVRHSRWLADAQDVVGSHHEKFDGSGYPKRSAGAAIPLQARIFAIADVFDALTSRRPYKDALSLEATLQILESGRGTHFDPGLLDLFQGQARALHERYAGRDDDALRDELRRRVDRLFTGDLETLRS